MIKLRNVKMIEVRDWDELVKDTYGKPYNFQQQYGCQERGVFNLTIPSEYTCDEEMSDETPEIISGKIMGVKFDVWLARDPNQPVADKSDVGIKLWWSRNFYPDIHTVANDLHKRGLIESGDYSIEIDW